MRPKNNQAAIINRLGKKLKAASAAPAKKQAKSKLSGSSGKKTAYKKAVIPAPAPTTRSSGNNYPSVSGPFTTKPATDSVTARRKALASKKVVKTARKSFFDELDHIFPIRVTPDTVAAKKGKKVGKASASGKPGAEWINEKPKTKAAPGKKQNHKQSTEELARSLMPLFAVAGYHLVKMMCGISESKAKAPVARKAAPKKAAVKKAANK